MLGTLTWLAAAELVQSFAHPLSWAALRARLSRASYTPGAELLFVRLYIIRAVEPSKA